MTHEQELLKLRQTTIQELIDFFSEDKEICSHFYSISNNDTKMTITKALKQTIPRKKNRELALCLLLCLKQRYEKEFLQQLQQVDKHG